MRSSILICLAACCLSACCEPELGAVYPSAPYSDLDPVPPEKYNRAYLRVMASSAWLKSKDQDVIVCGALGQRVFKPGVTVDSVVKDLHGKHFSPFFYDVAIWRTKSAALHGVRFNRKHRIEPSIRIIESTERLLAGDVVIVLEQMFCF